MPAPTSVGIMGGADGEPANIITKSQASCLPEWLRRSDQHIEQRRVAFGKVGRLRTPVVHLQVDVAVIVGKPARIIGVVPQPLQVGRQTSGP